MKSQTSNYNDSLENHKDWIVILWKNDNFMNLPKKPIRFYEKICLEVFISFHIRGWQLGLRLVELLEHSNSFDTGTIRVRIDHCKLATRPYPGGTQKVRPLWPSEKVISSFGCRKKTYRNFTAHAVEVEATIVASSSVRWCHGHALGTRRLGRGCLKMRFWQALIVGQPVVHIEQKR